MKLPFAVSQLVPWLNIRGSYYTVTGNSTPWCYTMNLPSVATWDPITRDATGYTWNFLQAEHVVCHWNMLHYGHQIHLFSSFYFRVLVYFMQLELLCLPLYLRLIFKMSAFYNGVTHREHMVKNGGGEPNNLISYKPLMCVCFFSSDKSMSLINIYPQINVCLKHLLHKSWTALSAL